MNSQIGWPYLQARNRTLGFQLVAGPSVISNKVDLDHLVSPVGWQQIDKDLRWKAFSVKNGRQFIALARIQPAILQGQQLTDGYGRVLDVVQGLVFEGTALPSVPIEVWERLESTYSSYLANFWVQEDVVAAVPTEPIPVNIQERILLESPSCSVESATHLLDQSMPASDFPKLKTEETSPQFPAAVIFALLGGVAGVAAIVAVLRYLFSRR